MHPTLQMYKKQVRWHAASMYSLPKAVAWQAWNANGANLFAPYSATTSCHSDYDSIAKPV
ncbi:Uncharacterised protein [Segatella copri]|nr:Uncharacterised protein [Segatella copri]